MRALESAIVADRFLNGVGTMIEAIFDYERLDVYQAGRELNREIAGIVRELPRGNAESADNLVRAGKSVTRNIAEGSARRTADDRGHVFGIARGSATEVGASLDELVDYGLVTEERVRKAKHLAWRVVSMLVNLIRAIPSDESLRAIKPGQNERARARGS